MAERLNRVLVLARAGALADEIGLDEVTITKLGRALGIAPPGVYRHVTGIADLRSGIGAQAAREVGPLLASACAGRAGKDALLALGNGLREWAQQHPGRYAALQIAPEANDREGQSAAEHLLAVIANGLRAYALEGTDLTDAIRMLRSTLHGFISLELVGGFKQPRDVEKSFRRILIALDTTFRAW